MWDRFRLPTVGKLFGSKIAVLLVAVIMSAFLVAATPIPTAYAAPATWNGDSLTYDNDTYTKQSLVLPGTDSTSQIFVSNTDNSKVIIIPGNADTTKDVDNAQQATYTVDANGNYSNQSNVQPVTVGAKSAASTGGTSGQNKTSCAVDGVGWIVCSMSKFLAGAMDKAYGWIAEYLTIKPLTTDTESGLFQTWNIARGFANACFIIAFLMIIYAQITNYGISNYEIKKMIPKLIVAAIAVNVSYYICAIAVDISNILGDSISKALTEIRQSLPAPDSGVTWNNLVATILSGGTIVAIPYVVGTPGGLTALVPLLAPMLIGGILSILVAVMVLAARQALVIVLVVLAPLAFVAYLLPNTEKLFSKWREIFTNMLIIFPLFSLLFGGAQLASSIIIQSTDKISVVLLAMFVQVAPLMITPFLMKFGHGLLTQVGGMMNNPRKGIVDRSRVWANEHSQMARDRYRAQGAGKSWWRPQAVSYKMAESRANRQGAMKVYQDQIAASVAQSKRAQELMADSKAAALKQGAGEATGERLFEQRKQTDAALQHFSGMKYLANDQVKALQTRETAAWEEIKSNKMTADNHFANFSTDAKVALRAQKIADGKTMFAQSEQSDEWAKLVISNENLQTEIGGIGGKDRALARATSEFRKNYGEHIAEGKAVMDHYNLSAEQRQAHALGQTVGSADAYGNFKIFHADSTYTRDAAVDIQARQGTVKELHELIRESGGALSDYSTTLASAIAEAGRSKNAIYAGGQSIDLIGHGKVSGQAGLDQITLNTILKGKIGATDLATMDADAIAQLLRVAGSGTIRNTLAPPQRAEFDAKVQAMQQAAYVALTNSSISGNVKDNSRTYLNGMVKNLRGTLYEPDGSAASIDRNRKY